MRLKLTISWLLFGIAALLGAQLDLQGVPLSDRGVSALWSGYAVWALFWGAPAVICWWWKHRRKGPLFLQLVLVVVLLPVACLLFSFYGGGIYQFLKTWWLVSKSRNQSDRAARAGA